MDVIIVVITAAGSGIASFFGLLGSFILALLPAAGAQTLVDNLFHGYDYDKALVWLIIACYAIPAAVIVVLERKCGGELGFWMTVMYLAVSSAIIGFCVFVGIIWLVDLIGTIEGTVTGSIDIGQVFLLLLGAPLVGVILGLPVVLFASVAGTMAIQTMSALYGLVSPLQLLARLLCGVIVMRLLILILLWC